MIVLIPIYKDFTNLSINEIKSIEQCLKILKNYKICFIFPEKINTDNFQHFFRLKTVFFKKFSNIYFESKDSYSLLLVSYFFYNTFKDYEYVLIYQPDAYIFRDNFEELFLKNYSYIGAPWLKILSNDLLQITAVGNGGFSLRNTNDMLRVLNKIIILKKLYKFYSAFRLKKICSYGFLLHFSLIPYLYHFRVNKFTYYLSLNIIINEDNYWCNWVSNVFPDFKIAPIEEAIKFSFECYPSFLFKCNNYNLPTGCHAWEINEPFFWENYIL